MRVVCLLSAMLVAGAWSACGQQALPEGPGLSADYPGDVGIADDARVVFAEDFEEATLNAVGARWMDVSNKDGQCLALSDDVPEASPGHQSLQVTSHLGQDTGGHLYRVLDRPLDTAFLRFYVKFPKDAEYVHHFVHFGGYNPPTRWPQGGAGERPVGYERMTVGIEPHGGNGRFAPPGAWALYTYWHEMKISADGRYWGNALHPEEPAIVPKDQWQCVELMLKMNTPGKRDGEMALWLDGVLISDFRRGVPIDNWTGMGFSLDQAGTPFEGFDFRTTDALKVNFLWLMLYVTENAARQNNVANPAPGNRVWFDHVVVADRYIGPIAPVSGTAPVR